MSARSQALQRILLVEDNPGDVDLILEVLTETSPNLQCTVAPDGVQAVRLLKEGLRPHLILLDLNLPKKDGRAVLAEIKTDPQIQHIPVIVLTSSEASRDLVDVYRLHANCMLSKPVDLEDFQRVIRAIDEFWLKSAKLPID